MQRTRPNPRPLDASRLEELALAYVARFATSAAKLEGYLARKLRERGWEGEAQPPVAALVARFVAAGYVDDAAYARAKSGSLLRRGYGARRVDQALHAAGIGEAERIAKQLDDLNRERQAMEAAMLMEAEAEAQLPAAGIDRDTSGLIVEALIEEGLAEVSEDRSTLTLKTEGCAS